jgi:hypothetical protein
MDTLYFPEDNGVISYEEALIDILLKKGDIDLLIKELKTYPICKKAVQMLPNLIQYVPQEFRTQEICKLAVSKWAFAFQWVPEEQKTYELSYIAIISNAQALVWVPVQFRTYELCILALKINPDVIDWVPSIYKTHDLYLDVIGHWAYFHGPDMIYLVPMNFRSIQFYITAMQGNRRCKDFIPEDLKDVVLQYF